MLSSRVGSQGETLRTTTHRSGDGHFDAMIVYDRCIKSARRMDYQWLRRYRLCLRVMICGFGLGWHEDEIDLSAKNADALRRAVARYVDAARRAPAAAARRPGRNGRRPASANGTDPTAVREWAKSQGIEVKDRGRVPAELVVKFKAATGQ